MKRLIKKIAEVKEWDGDRSLFVANKMYYAGMLSDNGRVFFAYGENETHTNIIDKYNIADAGRIYAIPSKNTINVDLPRNALKIWTEKHPDVPYPMPWDLQAMPGMDEMYEKDMTDLASKFPDWTVVRGVD